jgi:hypothetical protein
MAASQQATKGQPAHRGKGMSWPSKVFEFNPAGLNWPYGVLVLDIMLVPLLVFDAIGHKVYLLSAVFGVLLAAIADPGGGYGRRAPRVAVVALIGAGLTALGFGIGGDAWGWLVLAAFAVTLVAGLAVTFGVQSFIVALVLNVWFIVALGVAFSLPPHITSHIWAQVVAWAGGSALWIAATFIWWLVRGRPDRPPPLLELPGDTTSPAADPAAGHVRGDPRSRHGRRDRALVGTGPVARLLDTDRGHDRHEAEPGAVHAHIRTAPDRRAHRRRRGRAAAADTRQ